MTTVSFPALVLEVYPPEVLPDVLLEEVVVSL